MFPLILLAYVVAVKVFKKTAPNGKLTVYLGKRDFGDYGDSVEPVEGVVLVDSDYLKDRKVYGQVITTFRYGREEDEVMGLHFSRQLYLALDQVYPPGQEGEKSDLQDKLVRKLGDNAIPFTFDLPENAPPSVTLQPGPEDQGAPLGVEYELKLFIADSKEEKPHRRNSVSMAIRKLQYCQPGPSQRRPSTVVSKGFVLSPGRLSMEVTLDKEYYFHGDKVAVHTIINNYSKKTIRNIRVSVIQNTEVTMVNGHYHKAVAGIDSKEGCPIIPGATLSKIFYLLPSADDNKVIEGQKTEGTLISDHFYNEVAGIQSEEGCPIIPGATLAKLFCLFPSVEYNKSKRGVALDGMLKEGDTKLASSTLNTSDSLGIVISYMVRIRLYMGAIGGELVADVPLKLVSPTPEKERDVRNMQKKVRKQMSREMSTDLVFEDFARRRQYSEDNE